MAADATADRIERLEATVSRLTEVVETQLHQLARVVHNRLAPPVEQLSYAQCIRLGIARKTLERLVAAGVFTDHRALKRKGAPVRIYSDEFQAYRTDGIEGVRRLRADLGRD